MLPIQAKSNDRVVRNREFVGDCAALQELLDIVKLKPAAKAVRIDCADKWYEYFAIRDLVSARVLFALDMAGQPLADKHGAPLRLIDPACYGYKSAKLITAIQFVAEGKGSMACDIGRIIPPPARFRLATIIRWTWARRSARKSRRARSRSIDARKRRGGTADQARGGIRQPRPGPGRCGPLEAL
jgi:DMSO/TMAO reductase YedYZ molybdopterin-dependent catalytic subunit